jgi:hypothetical protein
MLPMEWVKWKTSILRLSTRCQHEQADQARHGHVNPKRPSAQVSRHPSTSGTFERILEHRPGYHGRDEGDEESNEYSDLELRVSG